MRLECVVKFRVTAAEHPVIGPGHPKRKMPSDRDPPGHCVQLFVQQETTMTRVAVLLKYHGLNRVGLILNLRV